MTKGTIPRGSSFETMMRDYGYIKSHSNEVAGSWWRPSGQTFFSPDQSQELISARESFYTPTISQDPFLNRTMVQMDDYNILIRRSTDAMGNTVEVYMDYRYMSLSCVVDANDNRVFYARDALSRLVASARSRKRDEDLGDNLVTTVTTPSESQKEAFFSSPTQENALQLIGGATTYRLYRDVPARATSDTSTTCHQLEFFDITRRVHYADGATAADLSIDITYLDGNLIEMQTASLTDTASSKLMWNMGRWSLKNSRGLPVRIFQPSLANSHEFVPPSSNKHVGAETLLYDPLSRLIGTIYADRAFSKVKFEGYKDTFYDRGDNVLVADPSKDEDIGRYIAPHPREDYFSSWQTSALRSNDTQTKTVATKSEMYYETADETHYDAEQRPVL